MKKIHRVLALLMAVVMALGLITTAFAEPTIDPGKKASLSIYKYDITKAGNDGAWDAESYVSTGLHDDAVIDKLSKYAIQGVEFTCLRVADITMNNELVESQRQVGVLYGFDGSERSNAVLSAIGLTAADAHKTEGGINYFTSDMLNNKLAAALAANATNVKNALETAMKNGGVAMPENGCHRPHFCFQYGAGPVPGGGNQSSRKCHQHLQSLLRVPAHDHRGRRGMELRCYRLPQESDWQSYAG